MKKAGYFEEYGCGCVSEIIRFRKNLLGYCGHHGQDRKNVYPVWEGQVPEGETVKDAPTSNYRDQ